MTSTEPLSGRMRPPFGTIIPEGERIHREEPFGRVQVKREADKKKPGKVVPPFLRTGGGFPYRLGRSISTMRAEAPPVMQVDGASLSEKEKKSSREKNLMEIREGERVVTGTFITGGNPGRLYQSLTDPPDVRNLAT